MIQQVEEYVRKTHGQTHNTYKLRVNSLLEVTDAVQNAKFANHSDSIPNHHLLWHGSRLANWAGILGQGLRIAPPEAVVSGYMFGKGL